MNIYEVIKEPVISEKATDLNAKYNQIVFKVDRKANKHHIKEAVEKIYSKNGVKVKSVRTMVMAGKPKSMRRTVGRTSMWKKAIVTLKEGSKLDFQ